MAIIFAIDGHLIFASIFICLAAVFDFLDGFVARLLKAYSEIGKQLDSLADVVSFGVAPEQFFLLYLNSRFLVLAKISQSRILEVTGLCG